jgi:2-polyprenyl-3-methyl-5-hydroxy-6-metoxy-1,4-benzoquinol methylase
MKEVSSTKAFYDKNAVLWTSQKTDSFYHELAFKKILSLWPEKASIIDIGCAGGVHVPLFLGMGHKLRYFGIDISKSFLKIATRRYPKLTFAQGNILDKESLPKKKFDGFWAAAVLMHVPFEKWDEMFSNLESVIKPNSFGYLSLPTEHPSIDKTNDTRHFTCLSPEEQINYIKGRGWKIKSKGVVKQYNKESIWHWYIVQLSK